MYHGSVAYFPFPFLNEAETEAAACTLTVHVLDVPEQAPPHPTNVPLFRFTEAVSVTTVPLAYEAEQLEPQLMPAGALTTEPGPDFETVTGYVVLVAPPAVVFKPKVAFTVTDVLPANVHGAVPLHGPPVQPPNTDPVFGVAESVMTVPAVKLDEQVVPHEMPAGVLVTVPAPLPVFATVTLTGSVVAVAQTSSV